MRIAVSGTHGSGKSTLIGAFSERHPEYTTLGDPYEVTGGSADVDAFIEQFHVAARRLQLLSPGRDVVLERCPVDFLAYLDAWQTLGRPGGAATAIPELYDIAAHAMASVDLLILLPLSEADGIRLPGDEDLELRDEMDAALLTLADDPGLVPDSVRVVEISGSLSQRLARLEEAV